MISRFLRNFAKLPSTLPHWM